MSSTIWWFTWNDLGDAANCMWLMSPPSITTHKEWSRFFNCACFFGVVQCLAGQFITKYTQSLLDEAQLFTLFSSLFRVNCKVNETFCMTRFVLEIRSWIFFFCDFVSSSYTETNMLCGNFKAIAMPYTCSWCVFFFFSVWTSRTHTNILWRFCINPSFIFIYRLISLRFCFIVDSFPE